MEKSIGKLNERLSAPRTPTVKLSAPCNIDIGLSSPRKPENGLPASRRIHSISPSPRSTSGETSHGFISASSPGFQSGEKNYDFYMRYPKNLYKKEQVKDSINLPRPSINGKIILKHISEKSPGVIEKIIDLLPPGLKTHSSEPFVVEDVLNKFLDCVVLLAFRDDIVTYPNIVEWFKERNISLIYCQICLHSYSCYDSGCTRAHIRKGTLPDLLHELARIFKVPIGKKDFDRRYEYLIGQINFLYEEKRHVDRSLEEECRKLEKKIFEEFGIKGKVEYTYDLPSKRSRKE